MTKKEENFKEMLARYKSIVGKQAIEETFGRPESASKFMGEIAAFEEMLYKKFIDAHV